MEMYHSSLMTKLNYDEKGNVITTRIEEKQTVSQRAMNQLTQFPDEYHRVAITNEAGTRLKEVFGREDIPEDGFKVNYESGIVFFNQAQIGQLLTFSYLGKGMDLISTNRIFHKYKSNNECIVETLDEITDNFIERVDGIVERCENAVNGVEETNERIQISEQERIERFDKQMEVIQQEILDKDSLFQSQMGQQAQIFDDKIKEVEDKILSDNNLFNQHLDVLDERFDEQLNEWQQEVDGLSVPLMDRLDTLESRFNLDLAKPVFYKTVRGVRTSVIQQFIQLPDHTCLISQAGASTTTDKESFTISRLSCDGIILDHMEVLEGGHGWFQARQTEEGIEVYFTDARERMIRTMYHPNHTLDMRLDKQYEILPNLTGIRYLMAIDFENDLIMLVIRNEVGFYITADIYSFSAFLNNTQTRPTMSLGSIIPDNQTLQGIGIRGNQAFFYSGGYGGVCELRVFDLTTETFTDYRYPHLGYAHDNDTSTVVEGEGLFIDKDTIYIGASTGMAGNTRYNHIYAIAPVEKQPELLSDALLHAQTFKLIEGNGFVKPVYVKPLNLSELTEPGEYYFKGSEFTFEDVPAEYKGGSGFFVHNSARAGDGTIYQIITRNTASGNCYRLGRQISGTTKVGAPWKALTPEKKTLHSEDTRQLTTFTLSDSISNYDFILVRIWSAGGQWQSFMFDSAVVMAQRGLSLQATNLPDSTSSSNVYFQELVCSIDEAGLVITQERKSQIHISSAGALTRSEEALIGICEIIGIRGFNKL